MALTYIYDNYKNKSFTNISENIVIFSPSFYWYKICDIPTKNLVKAKNIATHMMSDSPTDFKKISLQKKDDKYLVFSYNEETISNVLSDLNIKESKIYFTDQLNIAESISIDEENYLLKFNDKILQLCNKDQKITSSLKNSYLSVLNNIKPIINLKKDSRKNFILTNISVSILFIYVLLFGFDKINSLSDINNNATKLDTYGKSYYEIKSLIKKYKKLENNSNKMKNDLEKTLMQAQIKKIEYKNNKIKVTR